MRLSCECGHVNHVHFAGTGRCHGTLWLLDSGEWYHLDLSDAESRPCECLKFVPVPVERERADFK